MKTLIPILVTLLAPCRSIHEPEWPHLLHPNVFHGSGHEVFSDIRIPSSPSFPSVVAQSYQPSALHEAAGQCELYKVGFKQDLYFQYIQYKTEVPEMKEFTLCHWTKFTNHSNDHPIFSYAVEGQPRAIYAYVSNTERSSYYSLSVEGHTFYRLNYPLRLNRWYHTCQSWNGRTGEWQIWVNAERVGRGFHNRLVGHIIPQGGVAITGQEQRQIGGGFLEGKDAPQGSGGMLGEITMVQLYSVALTAGKAHRDHKHHHAHQYDKNGVPITTPPPTTTSPRPTLPTHPLLTGGQINPNVRINLAGRQPTPQPPFQGIQFGTSFPGAVVPGRGPQQFGRGLQPSQQLQFLARGDQDGGFRPIINGGLVHPSLLNPANVQFIDNTQLDTHQLFKRGNAEVSSSEDGFAVESHSGDFGKKLKRHASEATETGNKQKKRELLVAGGHLFDDSLISGAFDQTLLDGLAGIGQNEPILQKQKLSDEREPAEAEVKAVMSVCSGCTEEPFAKALVFGWRSVPKKLYSGAFYTPAVPECRVF